MQTTNRFATDNCSMLGSEHVDVLAEDVHGYQEVGGNSDGVDGGAFAPWGYLQPPPGYYATGPWTRVPTITVERYGVAQASWHTPVRL